MIPTRYIEDVSCVRMNHSLLQNMVENTGNFHFAVILETKGFKNQRYISRHIEKMEILQS